MRDAGCGWDAGCGMLPGCGRDAAGMRAEESNPSCTTLSGQLVGWASTRTRAANTVERGGRGFPQLPVAKRRRPVPSVRRKPRGDKDPAPHRANGQVAAAASDSASAEAKKDRAHTDQGYRWAPAGALGRRHGKPKGALLAAPRGPRGGHRQLKAGGRAGFRGYRYIFIRLRRGEKSLRRHFGEHPPIGHYQADDQAEAKDGRGDVLPGACRARLAQAGCEVGV